MKIILETDRLILRELTSQDALSFHQLNSSENVLRFTGDVPFSSVLEAEKFLINYSDYLQNGFGRWAVILKTSQKFIGWCGLKLHDDDMIDLGFRFFEDEWNKGYATESSLAVIQYGFDVLNIKTIVGRVAPDNKASVQVLTKVGMTFWKQDSCNGIENAQFYHITQTKKATLR